MRILGIDPGPEESAFCFFDGDRIESKGFMGNEGIMWHFPKPDIVIACEHLQCFGMAVGKETFETAYWIGEFRHAAKSHNVPFIPIFRSDVKMNLCQSMRAKPANIRQSLMDRFGVKGTKKNPGFFYGFSDHIWSAFAIAVTAYDKSRVLSTGR